MADMFFSLSISSTFLMVSLILTVSLYLLKAFKFEKKLKNKLSKMSEDESKKYIENLEDYEIEPKIKSVLVTFLKQKLPEKRIAKMLLNEMSEKSV